MRRGDEGEWMRREDEGEWMRRGDEGEWMRRGVRRRVERSPHPHGVEGGYPRGWRGMG